MKNLTKNRIDEMRGRETKRNTEARRRGVNLAPAPYGIDLADRGDGGALAGQAKGKLDGEDILQTADEGTSGVGQQLPFLETMQSSFGDLFDLSGVTAYIDSAASEACHKMGALAYTIGESVAFA